MNYFDAAVAYDMTADDAMMLDAHSEPLWKVRAASAHLSTLDIADYPTMVARMRRREELDRVFWDRSLAGEGLA